MTTLDASIVYAQGVVSGLETAISLAGPQPRLKTQLLRWKIEFQRRCMQHGICSEDIHALSLSDAWKHANPVMPPEHA